MAATRSKRRADKFAAKGVKIVLRPQPGAQETFSQTPADIAIYGGSAGGGKTWSLVFEPLRHIQNPDFGGVIFRRVGPQIRNPGGPWDESTKMYSPLGAEARETYLEWDFPSGARVKFAPMQYEKDKEQWQGSQICFIGWDELTHFEESQFWYMLSRNRSTCGVKPYIRATCNPDADSWVCELIKWWIDWDEDSPGYGRPIPERSGVVRWFIRKDGELHWGDSEEQMYELYDCYREGVDPEDSPKPRMKSLTFISATIYDNRVLMKENPDYLGSLMALPLVERERLLGGNWAIRESSGKVFNKDWFGVVDEWEVPENTVDVRYWDKASTHDGGDYTVGVRMGWHRPTGVFYIKDVVRGQWSSSEREKIIRETAHKDGRGVRVWVEQEPGSSGKEGAEGTIRRLAGFDVRAEAVTGEKVSRMMPLSAQAEAGNVKLVRAEWNKSFVNECHAVPEGKYDDQPDAASGAFNKLTLGPKRKRVVRQGSLSIVTPR